MNNACLWLIAPAALQAGMWAWVVYWPINYASWWGWTILIPRVMLTMFVGMAAWMISAFVIYWRYVP